jgi:hypothetical protein
MFEPRETITGMQGDVHWRRVLPETGLQGMSHGKGWERRGDAALVRCMDGGSTMGFGDPDASNFQVSVKVRPIEGGNVQIPFRITDHGRRHYLVDFLMGFRGLAVSVVDGRPGGPGLRKLSFVHADLRHGREYDLLLSVVDASLVTWLDGAVVNQVTDHELAAGGAGLSVWQAAAEFRDPRYRRL